MKREMVSQVIIQAPVGAVINRNPVNILYVIDDDDILSISFITSREVISRAGWMLGLY